MSAPETNHFGPYAFSLTADEALLRVTGVTGTGSGLHNFSILGQRTTFAT
jgi:hypothetical protein